MSTHSLSGTVGHLQLGGLEVDAFKKEIITSLSSSSTWISYLYKGSLTQTCVQALFVCFKLHINSTVTEVSFLTSLCSLSFNIRSQGLPILWTS